MKTLGKEEIIEERFNHTYCLNALARCLITSAIIKIVKDEEREAKGVSGMENFRILPFKYKDGNRKTVYPEEEVEGEALIREKLTQEIFIDDLRKKGITVINLLNLCPSDRKRIVKAVENKVSDDKILNFDDRGYKVQGIDDEKTKKKIVYFINKYGFAQNIFNSSTNIKSVENSEKLSLMKRRSSPYHTLKPKEKKNRWKALHNECYENISHKDLTEATYQFFKGINYDFSQEYIARRIEYLVKDILHFYPSQYVYKEKETIYYATEKNFLDLLTNFIYHFFDVKKNYQLWLKEYESLTQSSNPVNSFRSLRYDKAKKKIVPKLFFYLNPPFPSTKHPFINEEVHLKDSISFILSLKKPLSQSDYSPAEKWFYFAVLTHFNPYQLLAYQELYPNEFKEYINWLWDEGSKIWDDPKFREGIKKVLGIEVSPLYVFKYLFLGKILGYIFFPDKRFPEPLSEKFFPKLPSEKWMDNMLAILKLVPQEKFDKKFK